MFNIDAAGHPFYIKSKPVRALESEANFLVGHRNRFYVSRNHPRPTRAQPGPNCFDVSLFYARGSKFCRCDELTQAASPLYYICGIHEKMKGRICVGSCDAFSGVGSGFEQFGSETPSQTQTPNTINTNNVTTPSPARPTQADSKSFPSTFLTPL